MKTLGETKARDGLRFKDLDAFNKALLAKQLWRLIEYLDSLAGQILKSKYFPSTDVLEAKLSHNPSHIW